MKEKLLSQFTDSMFINTAYEKGLVLALCYILYLALPNQKMWNCLLLFDASPIQLA